MEKIKTGIELIAEERQDQIEKHGYDAEWLNDNPQYYSKGQLITAAQMLLAFDNEGVPFNLLPDNWPDDDCEKMLLKPYKERLVIASALIAAEIDRLQNIQS